MNIKKNIIIVILIAFSYCVIGCAEFMEDYSYSPVGQFSSASY